MRFALSGQQKAYFFDHGFLEFEGVLQAPACETLLLSAEASINQKIQNNSALKKDKTRFLAGHDLWRNSDHVKKQVFSVSLARLGAELFNTAPLRLAYDQFFTFSNCLPLLSTPSSLEEISSIQGLVGGLMICLKGKKSENEEESSETFGASPFPSEQGNVTYFSSTVSLNPSSVAQQEDHVYLLVAYASMHPIYRHNERDIHTHNLKDFGYVFGDILKENTHPLVYR